MRIDVKYAANVRPGDLFAGTVVPDAPTRPVQECAAAMAVSEVETNEGMRRYVFGSPVLVSGWFGPADQVLVIVPCEGAT